MTIVQTVVFSAAASSSSMMDSVLIPRTALLPLFQAPLPTPMSTTAKTRPRAKLLARLVL